MPNDACQDKPKPPTMLTTCGGDGMGVCTPKFHNCFESLSQRHTHTWVENQEIKPNLFK